jgi:septum formation inhibitor MinC
MAGTFGDRAARVALSHMAEAWLRLADNCQYAKEVQPAQQQKQIQRDSNSKSKEDEPGS